MLTCNSVRLGGFALEELQGQNAHSNKVASVDPFKRLSDDCFNTLQVGTPEMSQNERQCSPNKHLLQ